LGLLNFLLEATRKGLWHETQISHLCLKLKIRKTSQQFNIGMGLHNGIMDVFFLGLHSMSIFFNLSLSKYIISKYLNHLKFNLNLCLHWILTPYICLNFHY
jgi:hypothetical protein